VQSIVWLAQYVPFPKTVEGASAFPPDEALYHLMFCPVATRSATVTPVCGEVAVGAQGVGSTETVTLTSDVLRFWCVGSFQVTEGE